MINVIQEITNFSSGGVTSYALALTNPVQKGSSIHVTVVATSTLIATLGCSDSINGSYGAALDQIATSATGDQVNGHFKFDNTGSGTPTITGTSTVATVIGLWIREIANTDGYIAHAGQDQVHPGTGANAVTSGAVTPSYAPGLISAVVCEVVGSDGYSVGSGFTIGVHGDNTMTESIRYTTRASQAATATDSNGATGESVTLAAWFKEKSCSRMPLTGVG